ncbi:MULTISPECIES: Gfo/Idh/MocA family oxidoreductase [Mesorhizobium]|uniref:Gfo/Idh/MocA family protein n=1 Tax=Mesorhizobium TaxID=68287 RepID=UPI0007ECCAC2|nr:MULTISPECIES: Gfo/Idh/MocA family oxidoreductase [Mesorhizobium]PBB52935.1 gfo/Idh/MocA family oxidoreductase [Mesorhizobium loti]QIA22531.1 Gfo/Idh/MocA family oxidoreductase [Mesorhizobium sp. AA22]
MKPIKVAVLGACGWMGRVHSNAYAAMTRQFPALGAEVVIKWLVDDNEAGVREAARLLGVERVGRDWREAVTDPNVDLIDICLPDALHFEVAKAALQNGKHVYCEKPFTDTGAEADELVALAEKAGVITRVGHSFPMNPAHQLAREIIRSGEIGDITMFHGTQHVDSHGDPRAPFIWRLDGELARTGIVGDTGSHVFSFIDYLVGEVDELVAHCPIVFGERPDVPGATYGGQAAAAVTGKTRKVTNPDAGFLICRFKSGGIGTVDFSRIATGKRFTQRYEIYCTKGSITYDYDQITRLNVFKLSDMPGQQGFRAIDVGPEHSDYRSFLPLPNFGLGYNEIKMLEASKVIASIVSGQPAWPTFGDAKRIVALVDACMASHASRQWERVQN